jgi:hypothetical protein
MSVTTRQQKKLVRLISALWDMDESVQAANLLMCCESEELCPHLFTSMVVAYARPFSENYGVGRIRRDYPNYPAGFGDANMPTRHTRLLDLRNKFLAHSSMEGTRVQITRRGVANSLGAPAKSTFDYIVGKRKFLDVRYVEWLRVAPESFRTRLHADIEQLLVESFSDRELNLPFELRTGYENFEWT